MNNRQNSLKELNLTKILTLATCAISMAAIRELEAQTSSMEYRTQLLKDRVLQNQQKGEKNETRNVS